MASTIEPRCPSAALPAGCMSRPSTRTAKLEADIRDVLSGNVSGKPVVTCAVCLGTFAEGAKGHPVRHGFKAWNIRHGQSSGSHSGPCEGVRWPILEISAEGTRWMLGVLRDRIAKTEADLARHQDRPPLYWHSQARVRDKSKASPGVAILPGQRSDTETGAPSYDAHWRRLDQEMRDYIERTRSQVARYERVVASWAPGQGAYE